MIKVEYLQNDWSGLIVATFKGRLTTEEHETFLSQFESEIRQHAGVPVLFDVRDFQGWRAGSPWRKLSFDFSHRTNLPRIAIVGSLRRAEFIRKSFNSVAHRNIKRFRSKDFELAYSWSVNCFLNNIRRRHRDLGF